VLVREESGLVADVLLLCRRHARQVGLEKVSDSVMVRRPRPRWWQAAGMDEAAMALSSLDELSPLEALAVMYRTPCRLCQPGPREGPGGQSGRRAGGAERC
jgi:hypothetical protein